MQTFDAPRTEAAIHREFPAYGPIEAILGYVLFYVLVDRATPVVVETFSETVLDLSPSFLEFGLAMVLWFVLAVTAIDQVRRQLAALGFVSYDEYQLRVWLRVTPSSLRTTGYLVVVVGGGIAVLTFQRAVETLLSLILLFATVDPAGFDIVGLLAMVAFRAVEVDDRAPLLGRYDRVIEYDRQRPSDTGMSLAVLDRGHVTGSLAAAILRQHVLGAIPGMNDGVDTPDTDDGTRVMEP
jgi:hypothetical protein